MKISLAGLNLRLSLEGEFKLWILRYARDSYELRFGPMVVAFWRG